MLRSKTLYYGVVGDTGHGKTTESLNSMWWGRNGDMGEMEGGREGKGGRGYYNLCEEVSTLLGLLYN